MGRVAVQPVRLVLLLLGGARAGENDFLDFPSIEDAISYGLRVYDDRRFQLEGIEDARGNSLVGYDHLNDVCCSLHSVGQRRYG